MTARAILIACSCVVTSVATDAIVAVAQSQPRVASTSMQSFVEPNLSSRPKIDQPNTNTLIGVSVRVIRAEEPESEENTTQRARDIDPRLADITLQLNKLRYRHFTLMTLQQRQVQLMKRELITLPGGHSVNLRPIYLENNRVGMWIRWQDPSGAPVLDTRMHFSCGQTLVAGTESGDFAVDADPKSKSAMILAIDAKPQK